jgi:hypothetical protein
MTEDSRNTVNLHLFCQAANHRPYCTTWAQHRELLNLFYHMIDAQLKAIPDAMAVGKTVQQAKETGQTSVTGYKWTENAEKIADSQRTTVEYKPEDIHEVHWKRDLEDSYFWTNDPMIQGARTRQKHIEDVRAVTAVAYKGICRAHVFVDGQPDIWNEWK